MAGRNSIPIHADTVRALAIVVANSVVNLDHLRPLVLSPRVVRCVHVLNNNIAGDNVNNVGGENAKYFRDRRNPLGKQGETGSRFFGNWLARRVLAVKFVGDDTGQRFATYFPVHEIVTVAIE